MALAMERARRVGYVHWRRIIAFADEHAANLIVVYVLRPAIVVDDDVSENRVIVEVKVNRSSVVVQNNIVKKRIPGCTDVSRKSDADRLEPGVLIPMEIATDRASADRP